MPWIREVTPMSVVVARMIPRSVRKLRSLFLRSESRAMRVASQKALPGRRCSDRVTDVFQADADGARFVPSNCGAGCDLCWLQRVNGYGATAWISEHRVRT